MANWDKIQSEGNVEDRRGPSIPAGIGIVGTILVVGFVALSGGSLSDIQNVLEQSGGIQTSVSQGEFKDTKNYKGFAQKVIGSNNEIWKEQIGSNYKAPKLVLFRGSTNSGCGGATSAVGPHYCAVDQTVYLDETFFEELTSRFGARGGDVAEAYVMAHEVGHHIENLVGVFEKSNRQDNKQSVQVELQADCYAGFWSGQVESQGVITESEIGQALDAAAAVGDDHIQKIENVKVSPETWTHGSSQQRKDAFMKGFRSSNYKGCNFV